MARARAAAIGRFGLVVLPGGFGTPAFGDDHTVVRIAGARLVVDRGSARAASIPIDGSTLRDLAGAAGCDIEEPFEVGHDTPPLGDADEPLRLDEEVAALVAWWFDLGWRIVDAAAGKLDASRLQLWPEHFDAGCDVAVRPGGDDRCNLGASAGDGAEGTPYLYVGPWGADRPGDPSFWNEPFGASVGIAEIRRAADPVEAGVAFLRRGLDLFAGG